MVFSIFFKYLASESIYAGMHPPCIAQCVVISVDFFFSSFDGFDDQE